MGALATTCQVSNGDRTSAGDRCQVGPAGANVAAPDRRPASWRHRVAHCVAGDRGSAGRRPATAGPRC